MSHDSRYLQFANLEDYTKGENVIVDNGFGIPITKIGKTIHFGFKEFSLNDVLLVPAIES